MTISARWSLPALLSVSLSLGGCPEPKPAPPAATAEPVRSAAPSASPPSSASAARPAITHEPGTLPAPAPKKESAGSAKVPPTAAKIAPARSRKVGAPVSRVAFPGKGGRAALLREAGLDVIDLAGGGGFSLRHGGADAIAVSADEKRIALAGGGQISLWDYATGALLHAFPEDAGQIAFSPDGARLAIAGEGLLAVREVATGKELMRQKIDENAFGLSFGAGGKELVITAMNTMVAVFAADTGARGPGGGGAETGATFGIGLSPDGQWAAASAPSGHGMQVFAVHGWGPRTLVTLPDGSCQEHIFVEFSADGRHLYAHGGSRWVKGFDVGAGFKPYGSYHAPKGRSVRANAGDLSRVVTSKEDDTDATLITVSSGAETKLERPFAGSASYALSEDGLRLAGWAGGEVRVWSAKSGKVEYEETP
jgi:WD40 repeat protein